MAVTLIEVMISVAIIIVIGSAGMINLTNFRNRQGLDGTTTEIVSALRRAYSSAVSQEGGRAWGVYFENGGTGTDFYAVFSGNSYATGTIMLKKRVSVGSEFSDPSASSTKQVIFNKATGLPSASSTIVIRLKGNTAVSSTIRVNTQGAVSY